MPDSLARRHDLTGEQFMRLSELLKGMNSVLRANVMGYGDDAATITFWITSDETGAAILSSVADAIEAGKIKG